MYGKTYFRDDRLVELIKIRQENPTFRQIIKNIEKSYSNDPQVLGDKIYLKGF